MTYRQLVNQTKQKDTLKSIVASSDVTEKPSKSNSEITLSNEASTLKNDDNQESNKDQGSPLKRSQRQKKDVRYSEKDGFTVFDKDNQNIENLEDYDIPSLKSPQRKRKVSEDSDFENKGRISSRLRKMPVKYAGEGPQKRARKAVGKDDSVFDLIMKWKTPEELENMPSKKTEVKAQRTLNCFFQKNTKTETKVKQDKPLPKDEFQMIEGQNLNEMDLSEIAKVSQAILMTPPWRQQNQTTNGITLEDFTKLQIPRSIMADGIIFIWVEKYMIHKMIKYFATQHFQYVENLSWVMLDPSKRQEIDEQKTIDISPAFYTEDYSTFKKAKCTLLMFRRITKATQKKLELRHQRTCDVCFDWYDQDKGIYQKPQGYIYNLIETLLPKGIEITKGEQLKLVEMWSDKTPRKGWIKIHES